MLFWNQHVGLELHTITGKKITINPLLTIIINRLVVAVLLVTQNKQTAVNYPCTSYMSRRWRIPAKTGVVVEVSAFWVRVATVIIVISCILVTLRSGVPLVIDVAGVVLLARASFHNVDDSMDCHLRRHELIL